MANLTNQQIKDTYPGLLNLNIATTGITSTPQQITDGLGNNTGSQIGTNFFYAPSLFGIRTVTPDNIGTGVSSISVTPPTGNTNNNIYFFPFYDTGYHVYSAITTIIPAVTTTNDVMTAALYSSQLLYNGYGVMPYQNLLSGITLPTTGATNAMRTTTLPQNFSFSGTGPGIYYLAINIQNAGVSPTFRWGQTANAQTGINNFLSVFYGSAQGLTTNILNASISKGGLSSTQTFNGGWLAQYSESDIVSRWITSGTSPTQMGFLLRTVR